MARLWMRPEECPSPVDLSTVEGRQLSIQRCIMWLKIHKIKMVLLHTSKCFDEATCQVPECKRLKRVWMHTKTCQKQIKGDCRLCQQFMTLVYRHAQHCQESDCPVIYCTGIQDRLNRNIKLELTKKLRLRMELLVRAAALRIRQERLRAAIQRAAPVTGTEQQEPSEANMPENGQVDAASNTEPEGGPQNETEPLQ